MTFPRQFIAATEAGCSFEQYVPAPLMRKSFPVEGSATEAEVLICGLWRTC